MAFTNDGSEAVGVLMAGGAGLRMVAGGQSITKPLVPVLGAPLVERNVWAMLRAGLADVRVVVSATDAGSRVGRWARTRGARVAAAAGAELRVVVEPSPLGNCGALNVAVADDDPRPVVLAFADNLTDLDLAQLVATMHETAADLVLAVHDEPFALPYGVVDLAGARVTGYREKPEIAVRVGSGLAVVGRESRRLVDGPTGLVDLVNNSVAAGRLVVAHPHQARWVDVNDPSKVVAAEAMVRSHPDGFEQWWPDSVVTHDAQGGTAFVEPRGVLLDDLDPSGRAVRVWSGLVARGGLSNEGQVRVSAWRRTEVAAER